MCGIFGISIRSDSGFSPRAISNAVSTLFRFSESRGKEAAGLAVFSGNRVDVFKDAIPPSRLIRTQQYKRLTERVLTDFSGSGPLRALTLIGHSRLVTNGSQETHHNNQPIVAGGIVGIHNGIIVNAGELFTRFPSLRREYEVDTEVLLRLIEMFRKEGKSVQEAVGEAFGLIEGAASVALGFADTDCIVMATNTGSLYICCNRSRTAMVFASERYILSRLMKQRFARGFFSEADIMQLKPGFGYCVSLIDLAQGEFPLRQPLPRGGLTISRCTTGSRTIVDHIPESARREAPRVMRGRATPAAVKEFEALSRANEEAIARLRRCTRCILPETMPFITFDDEGVCNYCRGYKKIQVRGHEVLLEAVKPYRRTDGEPECIVSISGGRDSTYSLHYVKNVLGMNPIAYTYDWGMVTDLARRNISRICGKLGIEHILVSADIAKKRRYIRKNVEAWLKRPDLGVIPLFMAGDKQYFHYLNKLKRRTGIRLAIYAENPLERTDFKLGFCGVREDRKRSYADISLMRKAKLAAYYVRQFLLNPRYLNRSLFDTMFAFISTYGIQHDYVFLFNYIPWDEKTVTSIIKEQYHWEVAPDTPTTWRIGDGTAAFYNYIYYTVAGFTENDTFRSNQVREGMLTRTEAFEIVRKENRPRFDSILWYCETIGIDFERTIAGIHAIPKYAPISG